ncbi:hypothetical protein Q1695_012789 [Nippostrongylus brasiliensis]|nr:hypothetical protein Q1695_012789 [Nippostrongylus brasiliensis]
MKTKRTCVFCQRIATDVEMRVFPVVKTKNAILFVCLGALGYFPGETVEEAYRKFASRHKYSCPKHYVEVGKYICTEMAMVGKFYTESNGRAFVTLSDIPDHVVQYINCNAARIDDDITVTQKDLWEFLNDTLRRYYATPLWFCNDEIERSAEAPTMKTAEVNVAELVHNVDQFETAVKNEPMSDEENCGCSDGFNNTNMYRAPCEPRPCHSSLPNAEERWMKEPDPLLSRRYFLVQGDQLMKLFKFCPECGSRLDGASLNADGTAAVVDFVCRQCNPTSPTKQWESQPRLVPLAKDIHYRGNVSACVAAITTGVQFEELERWANWLNFSMFSKSYFCKVMDWVRPAVETVYATYQELVMDVVISRYKDGDGLDLSTDNVRDSKSNSDGVIVADSRTGLILHSVLHRRSKCENFHKVLDAIEAVLEKLSSCSTAKTPEISSLTTDRVRYIEPLLRELRRKSGSVRHYYHRRYLLRRLAKELRKLSMEKSCKSIAMWTDQIKEHCRNVMRVGSGRGADIPSKFNTCLMHVKDVHEWKPNATTGPYTRCDHDSLNSQSNRDRFQSDLAKASPFQDISTREFNDALKSLSQGSSCASSTRTMYIKMATMHVNCLRLATIRGGRERTDDNRSRRSPELKLINDHHWLNMLLYEVLSARYRISCDEIVGEDIPQEMFQTIKAEALLR